MDGNIPQLAALADHVAALAAARSPADVFRRLLEASKISGPRGVIFLVRQDRLIGWGNRGYDSHVSARIREQSFEAGAVWVGRALEPGVEQPVAREPGEELSALAAPPAIESFARAVRVAGRPAAVLVVERGPSDPPCLPTVLTVLATVAGQRLECDLAWRKAHAGGSGSAGREATAPPAATGRAAETPEPTTPEAGLSLSEPAAPEDAEPARQTEARSFARLVATDIRLYNEEAVLMGREHRDLAQRLGDQIDRARDTFKRRFGDMGHEGLDLLQDALVQVLAAGDATLLPSSES